MEGEFGVLRPERVLVFRSSGGWRRFSERNRLLSCTALQQRVVGRRRGAASQEPVDTCRDGPYQRSDLLWAGRGLRLKRDIERVRKLAEEAVGGQDMQMEPRAGHAKRP